MAGTLTHLDATGAASMVDVGDKPATRREAMAEGLVMMRPETLALIVDNAVRKGDVVAIARIAGIMAAKRTSELIPLCHPLALAKVAVDLDHGRVAVTTTAQALSIAEALNEAGAGHGSVQMIDSTIIRAHQHAAADVQVYARHAPVAGQGDHRRIAGGEGDLAHAPAAGQGDALVHALARVEAVTVELHRRAAADVQRQVEGQALQRAAARVERGPVWMPTTRLLRGTA